ncbi:MAG TPA: CRTAC1 family protein [Terracidiphilus sp.]|nr:CRTAC1 family protein [Terracidiphilus sp.]
MKFFPNSGWSRRKLLQAASAMCASAVLPRGLRAAQADHHAAAVAKPFSTFTDVAASAGLTATMYYGVPEAVTYIIEEMGGGCAFFDYDNDGWMDIFILGGRTLENVPPGASNRLYKNNRDGTFKDVTKEAGLWDAGWAVGVCVGDYNNDGFEDLFLTYYGQNKLYHNNGNGTFTDVTEKAHLTHNGIRFGAGCTFIDYNRDGLLDLFVSNYVDIDMDHALKPSLNILNCNYEGVPVACGPKGLKAPQHFLYKNNGDGTFTDVSKESGIAAIKSSYGLTAVTFDVDEDGWPDLFVACDTTQSLLLLNNHDGTFREEGLMRGVAISPDGQEMAGMGIGVGDFDLDGHLDVVKTHFQLQATGLYKNDGKGNFDDVAHQAGLAGERTYVSWGTCLFDLDNDGYPDIFWVTGNVYAEVEKINPKFPYKGPRVLFRNRGNGIFARMGDEAGPAIGARHVSRGCAFGDFDNDGDLDIVIMNQHEPPSLLRNDAPKENHWIKVRLEGTKSNRSAIGARVLVRYGGKTQAQAVLSQASYMSSNDPRLHFGLGSETHVDLEVIWPSGAIEKYSGQSANQLVTILEGHGIIPGRPFRKA